MWILQLYFLVCSIVDEIHKKKVDDGVAGKNSTTFVFKNTANKFAVLDREMCLSKPKETYKLKTNFRFFGC